MFVSEREDNIKVSIIIPVFNKVEFTQRCIKSVFDNSPEGSISWEIVVVDNASSDGTAAFLEEACQLYSNLRVVTNKENLGFARACNQGASWARGEYLLFLNNDTEVQKGWLKPLVEVLNTDFRVGAVGCKLLFPDGFIQHAGVVIVDDKMGGVPLVATHIYYKKPASLKIADRPYLYQVVTGACLMVRKVAFEEVGGFDEEYWNGYEDVDLCFKLQKRGWLVVYEPKSVVIHYEGQSGPERFRKVNENVARLHQRWLGRINPDFVIEIDGSVKAVKPPAIKEYQPPFVSIIILTRNNLEYTQKCLESIRKYTPEAHEVIVVDNGSTDGTVEYLESQSDVKLVKNGFNLGFALGNNRGLLEAGGNYVIFLNNDVVVTEGWLRKLIACAESDPSVGIVGPRSNYVAGHQLVKNVPYGEDMEAMQEFARSWSEENSGNWEEVLRVIGFCMLVKREVIEKIGGFDPQFGLGNFEDDDFCIRARIAGFRIKIAHDVFVHHFGSKTFQSEQIDYRELMLSNWEKFKRKWNLPGDLPILLIERGYHIDLLLQRDFDPQKHTVPLQIEPYPLDGVRLISYLAPFSKEVLKWYLSSFSSEDDVTLVLHEEGDEREVLKKVSQTIEELGFDPDKTPDILLITTKLDENKQPRLIRAVKKVVWFQGLPDSWKRWVVYLGKETEEIGRFENRAYQNFNISY